MLLVVKTLSTRFCDDNRGAIAIMFALLLVPVLMVVGASIDYGRASTFESSMQKVLDEAVLDGARTLARTRDAGEAVAAAQARFAAWKGRDFGVTPDFRADKSSGHVRGVAAVNVPTYFLGVAGIMSLRAAGEAVASAKPAMKTRKRTGSFGHSDQRQISAHQLESAIAQAEQICDQLQAMGMGGSVPQCFAVYDGTFAEKVRAAWARGGNVSNVMPGGVRLVR